MCTCSKDLSKVSKITTFDSSEVSADNDRSSAKIGKFLVIGSSIWQVIRFLLEII